MDSYFVDTEETGQHSIKLRFGEHSAGGRFFSTAEVHEHWKSNGRFCDVFSQALAAVPMAVNRRRKRTPYRRGKGTPFLRALSGEKRSPCDAQRIAAFI